MHCPELVEEVFCELLCRPVPLDCLYRGNIDGDLDYVCDQLLHQILMVPPRHKSHEILVQQDVTKSVVPAEEILI